MSEGVSHSEEVLARGKDLLRFLETQGQHVEGLSKTALQSIYDTQYLTYRRQIDPGEPSIPFNQVFKTLIENLVLRLQGGLLHHVSLQSDGAYVQSTTNSRDPNQYFQENAGASNFNVSQQTFSNSVRPSSSGAAFSHHRNDTVYNDRGAKPKKKKHTGNLLAVDQHIIIHRTPTVHKETSEELAAFQASISHLPSYVTLKGQVFDCSPCGAKCTSKGELLRHLEGRRHRLSVITMKLKSERESLILDKGNIQIKADCDGKNGTYFIDLREGVRTTINMTIKNVSADRMVELVHCEMLKRIRVFTLSDEKDVTEHQNKVTILPESVYLVKITAMAKNVGNYHTPLGFHFNVDGQEFHIVRFIHARCKSAITDQVKSSKPYKRPPRQSWRREAAEIIEGYPLPKWSGDNLPKKISLERYRIPDSLRKIINHGLKINLDKYSETDRSELSSLRSILEKPLSWDSYDKRFSAMNHFEETQMEVDIRKYDMEAVTMRSYPNNHRLLTLEVPGLSENRPSVLRGDWLYVRICTEGSTADREYQGYVHEVRQNEVALGFNKKLMDQYMRGLKFNVRFVFNRLPLRLQHRACALAKDEGLEDFLFPTARTICSRNMNILSSPLILYNKDLENNEQQKQAIKSILSGISRPAPYLVFGPPGTGKTVTIVEAMMQIWKNFKKCRILACAPSNSAADLIAMRLLNIIPKNDIMRLNAFSRSWDLVPRDVQAVSNYDRRAGQYYYPSQDAMEKYKIIICTLVTAGRLVSANFPSCHFSHFFIDESGHAVEPECIIPLAGILNTDPQLECGQVVLAGDPEQLGPILRSPFAIEYKLDVSLLQRYMTTCEVYKRHGAEETEDRGYDNRIITKLLHNYRSHPAILQLPNQSFYEGELICSANQGKRETFCRWEGLPQTNFPVIFHGVLGQDEREERSPSFFNAAEVDKVWYYIDLLMKNKGYRLNPKDIGVISPYRKQVQKIQALLKKKSLTDIHVGSVEEFQGQERLVIIVSTVRSNPDYLSLDIQYRLGFLKNPKRFNVTLTRAKALLVVIGNPQTLSHDKHWKSFIDYCKENGGYTGFKCDQEEEELLDLEERLKLMRLWDQEELDKTAEFVQEYGIRNDSAITRDK